MINLATVLAALAHKFTEDIIQQNKQVYDVMKVGRNTNWVENILLRLTQLTLHRVIGISLQKDQECFDSFI